MELKNKIIKALHEYAVLAIEWGTEEDPEISLQEDYFGETAQEISQLIMKDRYDMIIEYSRLVGFAQGCLAGANYHITDPEVKELIKNNIEEIDQMCDNVVSKYKIEIEED